MIFPTNAILKSHINSLLTLIPYKWILNFFAMSRSYGSIERDPMYTRFFKEILFRKKKWKNSEKLIFFCFNFVFNWSIWKTGRVKDLKGVLYAFSLASAHVCLICIKVKMKFIQRREAMVCSVSCLCHLHYLWVFFSFFSIDLKANCRTCRKTTTQHTWM